MMRKAIRVVKTTAYFAAVGVIFVFAIGGIIQDLFGEPHHSYQRQPSQADKSRMEWALDQTSHSDIGVEFEALPTGGGVDAPFTTFAAYSNLDNKGLPCDEIVYFLTTAPEITNQLRAQGFQRVVCYAGSETDPSKNSATPIVTIPPPAAVPQPSAPAKQEDSQEEIRTA